MAPVTFRSLRGSMAGMATARGAKLGHADACRVAVCAITPIGQRIRSSSIAAPSKLRIITPGARSRRTTTTLRVQAGAFSVDASPLTSWLSSTGGVDCSDLPVKISLSDGAPTLVASRAIKEGETLLQIPDKAWVTPETVSETPIGPSVQGLEPWVQLVLFLVREESQGSSSGGSSAWAPYHTSLPAGNPSSPLFWDDDLLSMLEGTQCLANTMGYREFLEGKFEELEESLFSADRSLFPAEAFTREAFFRAFGWLRARVHQPLEKEDIALVPLADLAQHSSRSKAVWSVRQGKVFGLGGGKTVVLDADRPYEAGEQILMNFAPRGIANQLALDYGVADTRMAGFSLTLSVPEDDRFFDDKADIAEINGFGESWTWTLRPDERVSEELMAFLRLINCSAEDSFHLEALFRDAAWGHFLEPISPENEEAVCKSIVDGCMGALGAYATSIDEDLALLRGSDLDEKQRMAVQIRLGEKQTLDAYQRFFASRLDTLDDLEYYAESRLKSLGLLDDNGERPTFEGMLDSGIA